MDYLARKYADEEKERHQRERRATLEQVAALALVGRMPTSKEYTIYHCYTFLLGKAPLAYGEWVESLIGGRDGRAGMDVSISGDVFPGNSS
jgi:hypothetical protein